jgi:deoxyribodipyrimidine photo-lyase
MTTALVWFRNDLRVQDNPALATALNNHSHVIPVYIHDPQQGDWSEGAASDWWRHHSLAALKQELKGPGSDLLLYAGDPQTILDSLIQGSGVTHVYWNRRYEPDSIAQDRAIKASLQEASIEVQSLNGCLLIEPWLHLKKDDTPYRVFTPFWKALQPRLPSRPLVQTPEEFSPLPGEVSPTGISLEELQLLPKISWDEGFYAEWTPGSEGAEQQLQKFCDEAIPDYLEGRDIPGLAATSRLSPHLHFGEISPQQVWETVSQHIHQDDRPGMLKGGEGFLRELAWREFSYHLLFHFPDTTTQPLNPRFSGFEWRDDYAEDLQRWQTGNTGIPIIDAGMRELWHTGWMHNRVRMLVASFLTKNLLIPWQEGARWFWDTLVDADLPNNTQGWQWTAGSGADAAPYFRIFNPVTQGERFDPQGHYVRRWVPELASLENRFIHQPWQSDAPPADYPTPMVDLKATRERALERWQAIRKDQAS